MTAAQIDKRMTKARSALVISQPFFGTLALHLEIVEDASIQTMATDGKQLLYAPAFLDKLTPEETRGVVAHETLHCAYRHHTRRQKRDPKLWNMAGDYVINKDLLAAGFTLPADGLFDKANRFDGMSAEKIYDILKQEDDAKPKDEQQQGTKGDPGGCGEVMDAADESEPAQLAEADREWEINVREALNVSKAGKAPAALKRIAKEINRQVIDWRDLLRRFIDDATQRDYSWMHPNKRMLAHGLLMPGLVKDGVSKIGLAIDTSGSINGPLLDAMMAEIKGAMDTGIVQTLVVISCDAHVQHAQEFGPTDEMKVEPKGGGGTNFRPAFDWFAEHHPDCAAIIYFTDMFTNDFGEEPACPTMWGIYGNWQGTAPFGDCIHLDAA